MRPKTKLFAVKFRSILDVLCLQGLPKKFWAQFHDLCVQIWSDLLWSSDAFWKFTPFKLYKKSSGRIFPIDASKNEVVCRGVQTDFKSSLPASFTEEVVGAIPRLMRAKMKLFAVKFRRILEVLCLQVLKKKFWVQFQDVCVQKLNCLLWNSNAFRKSPPSTFTEKFLDKFSRFVCPKTKLLAMKFRTILQPFRLQIW